MVMFKLKKFYKILLFSSSRLYKTETNYHVKLLWSKYTQKIRMDGSTPYLVLRENQRFSMVRFSTIKNCYLLPAAPSVYEAVLCNLNPIKYWGNQLPKGYFAKTKCTQPKQLICETKEQLCLRPLMSMSRHDRHHLSA
jgi:hypothetical protein